MNIRKINFEFFVNFFGIGNYYSDFLKLHITIQQVYFVDALLLLLPPSTSNTIYLTLCSQSHTSNHGICKLLSYFLNTNHVLVIITRTVFSRTILIDS